MHAQTPRVRKASRAGTCFLGSFPTRVLFPFFFGVAVMVVGDDFYEDLTPETTVKVLSAFAKGEKPKPGPQSGRKTSEVSMAVLECANARSHAVCAVSTNVPERRATMNRFGFWRIGLCHRKHRLCWPSWLAHRWSDP